MPEKLPSEIIKIELDDATFKGTHAVIEPTYGNHYAFLHSGNHLRC